MPRQVNEAASLKAMVTGSADRFWALTDSLLEDGYLPTESILVLQDRSGTATVKEGNRRVAALKLILGQIPSAGLNIPAATAERIANATAAWKRSNNTVPCTVFPESQRSIVDRLVRLVHGKGDKASRDQWNPVARARYQRDEVGTSEPGLDLLEAYLRNGANVTPAQKARWGAEFPLSVLDEAAKRLARRCGAKNAPDLANRYPNVDNRDPLEAVIHAIGQNQLTFLLIRDANHDFALDFGIPPQSEQPAKSQPAAGPTSRRGSTGSDGRTQTREQRPQSAPRAARAIAVTDPRGVKRALGQLVIRGERRGKVEALRSEAHSLDIRQTPMTFCIVLRTLLELSARAYCRDHQGRPLLRLTKENGKEKSLAELLKDVMKDLVNSQVSSDAQQAMRNRLHGASTELARRDSLLSVTSMNQVVHNESFAITPTDISTRFGNVLPLLEELNA